MKKAIIFLLFSSVLLHGQTYKQEFIDTDVLNFWDAYDKVVKTRDTLMQDFLLDSLYIKKASPGLQSLMQVRNYSHEDYRFAITQYPKFWKSIRRQTLSTKKYYPTIESNIQKLRELYPALKPAPIYFSVGTFRTNGTTHQGQVLIACETALAGANTATEELPDWRKPFYEGMNPAAGLSLLCAHEYVHISQNEFVENLLSKCLYEGVAEFVSCEATSRKSNVRSMAFGKENHEKVVSRFVNDMFNMTADYDWIWGENTNDFQVRDLGYYIGYEICARYFDQSTDKASAIEELIELDYNDEASVERIVDASKLFPKPLSELYAEYDARRPKVTGISPFENQSLTVAPKPTKIKIIFSEALNGQTTSVDFGPLGQDAFPKLIGERIWADDAKSWTIEADLLPNKKYQILISNNFRKPDGTRLKPFLIEFQTTN